MRRTQITGPRASRVWPTPCLMDKHSSLERGAERTAGYAGSQQGVLPQQQVQAPLGSTPRHVPCSCGARDSPAPSVLALWDPAAHLPGQSALAELTGDIRQIHTTPFEWPRHSGPTGAGAKGTLSLGFVPCRQLLVRKQPAREQRAPSRTRFARSPRPAANGRPCFSVSPQGLAPEPTLTQRTGN